MQILRQYKEQDLLFIDIETARSTDKLEQGSDLRKAFEYKFRYNNEMKEKMERDGSTAEVTIDEFYKSKAALYGTFGRIVAIVVGRIEGDQIKLKAYKGEEKQLLEQFSSDLRMFTTARPDACFASFNGISFDSPFIAKRMIVHDILLHPLLDTHGSKPWDIRHLDLSVIWRGQSFFPDSLVAVAAALGIPSSKGGMDGSEVSDAFYTGRIDEIVEYCKLDVLCVGNMWRKFNQKKLLTIMQP